MARITLVLNGCLFQQIKKKAADEGRTFPETVNDLLRFGLAETARRDYRLNWQGWEAVEQLGINILSRDSLLDKIDES